MSAFEDFVNLELPRRSAFLTKAITGHDASPNVGPPAILSGAPLGSWFRQETAAKWWRKTEASWEEQNAGVGGGGTGSGVVLTQRVDATAGPTGSALPSASAYTDEDLATVIETSGLNLVNLSPDGSETINGSTSDFVVVAQGSVLLMSDGVSNWDVVAEYVPGPAASASTVQGDLYTCGVGVAVRDAVYLSAADTVDKADADGVGTQPLIGFVVSKPTTTTCRVIYYGEIPGFTGLTIGVNYFLSETAGGITSTAPTVGGSIIQKVGFARSATTLVVFIDRDYFEN